jgi:hypothetical protein
MGHGAKGLGDATLRVEGWESGEVRSSGYNEGFKFPAGPAGFPFEVVEELVFLSLGIDQVIIRQDEILLF